MNHINTFKGAPKSKTKIIFVSATKKMRKHNQYFKLAFFKINLHFGTSNLISTYGKPPLLLINSTYFSFSSTEMQSTLI